MILSRRQKAIKAAKAKKAKPKAAKSAEKVEAPEEPFLKPTATGKGRSNGTNKRS